MNEAEVTEQIAEDIKRLASTRAKVRARTARWDLDTAVFSFAILIIVFILLFQDIEVEIVAPVALFGLVMVWFVGWRRGRQLYITFYEEEIARLTQRLTSEEKRLEEAIEETIEEKVQKALRERLK